MRFSTALPWFLLCLFATHPLHAQAVLNTNPGPSNNGGSAGNAILFDLEANTGIVVSGLTTASNSVAGATFTVRISTRAGTALGGPVAMGPGSSAVGWTVLGTAVATQGSGEVSLPINIPEIPIAAGQVVGVAVEFLDSAPRYFGTASPPVETYANSNLIVRTGDARSIPFTTTGSHFSSRTLVGSVLYRLADAVLPANPGPDNNGGANNSGMLLDLQSSTGAVVTGMTIATDALEGGTAQIEVFTRSGTALGNVLGSGPATSMAGWTPRGTVTLRQGPGQISLPITLPPLTVTAGQTLGVGLRFLDAGPRYFGVGETPVETYTSPGLSVITGQAMTIPFSNSSSVFGSRALIGSLSWRLPGQQLPAAAGPSNNSGAPGFGMFMDLQAQTDLVVTGLSTGTQAVPNGDFALQVFTRNGSTLGGTSSSGPTSSNAGWNLHASVSGRQGATGQVSLPIAIPDLPISAGQTIGVALIFPDITPAYVGTGVGPVANYNNPSLHLTTGEVKGMPFTTTGNYFVSRELLGKIYYRAENIFSNGFE